MRQFDLYGELVRTQAGILKAYAPANGIILYGRVNNRLSTIPECLSKYADEIANKNLALYVFDIFASQWGLEPHQTAAASDGRVLLLLPDTQPEYEISVFNTKLTYIRQSIIGPSREANLVVGCFWTRQDKKYSLEPAKSVTADMMNIEPEDIEIFKTNLISPDTFKSAQIPFQHRIGGDCPLLTGDDNPLPAFYDTTPNGEFVLIKSLRPFMNCLKDKHLAETRPDWGICSALSEYIGYARNELAGTGKATKEPNAITRLIIGELESADAKFRAIQEEHLANQHEEFSIQLSRYLDNIKSYLLGNLPYDSRAITSKTRVKALLVAMFMNTDSEMRGADEEVSMLISDLSPEQIIDTLLGSEDDNDLYDYLEANNLLAFRQVRVLLSFLWSVLKLKSNFSDLLNHAQTEAQLAWYVLRNPYALTFISPCISVSDLDMLASFVGKASNPQMVLMPRSVAYMHDMLINHDSKSILFEQGKLIIDTGYKLTKQQLNNYTQTGSILNPQQIEVAQAFDPDCDYHLIASQDIVTMYDGSALVRLNIFADWVLQQYLDCGLGIQIAFKGKKYLMDTTQAKQFCYIITRVIEDNKISRDKVDYSAYIQEFADYKGYVLEPEQKSSAELLNYTCSCLTGPAGSGKTTVLEMLIHCLKREYDIKDNQIVFVAPTGKAAKRITECTGYPARTIHSQFSIASENVPYEYATRPASDFNPEVVIFDEASMIALPLLYQALMKIPEGTRIIFAGDIEQLPPINTGKPFSDLLTILPYERLLVSKRAKEGSAITRNCNALLSNKLNELSSGQDAMLVSALENQAYPDLIANICRYYLHPTEALPPLPNMLQPHSKIEPNDIQVVTPVAKSSYIWGTTALNETLREVFNPKFRGQKKVCFRDAALNDVELRIGDRVINSINNAGTPRYVLADEDTLVACGNGILNGDIGIIKDIRVSSELNFLKYDTDGNLVPDKVALKVANVNTYGIKVYVLVEFKDVDNKSYIVIYAGHYENNSNSLVVPSSALRNLALAYAITVHKMEGSQSKIVIAPLFKCKARGFVSKNLVYTAWSRASEALYVVGDVSIYQSSALGTASKINNLATRITPCDIS